MSQANSEWYGFYKKLRVALANLSASADSAKGSVALRARGSISVKQDYDPSLLLTPVASESLKTLVRATKQLLATGESSPGGSGDRFDVTAAEACRKV